ncbi:hypothetical protein LCGC14_2685310, partial [marine sediment metagenome]
IRINSKFITNNFKDYELKVVKYKKIKQIMSINNDLYIFQKIKTL